MTDEPLYLEQVQLRDFRSFGPDSCLRLPPGPGLTVLVGANGLGKSSFFDGIQWALTGKAERLEQIGGVTQTERKTALRRHGAQGPTLAQLTFTGGIQVQREEKTKAPFPQALVAKDWKQLPDPGELLAFTHLLGQSARQRFVNRNARERFSLIETISRLKDIWEAQKKLGRPKFNQALEAAEKEARQESENASTLLKDLEALRERRAALLLVAHAERVLPPDEVLAAATTLAGEMRVVGYELPACSGAEQALAALSQMLVQCDQDQAERLARLDQADTLAEDIGRGRSALDSAFRQKSLAELLVQKIEGELRTLDEEIKALAESVRRAETDAAAAKRRLRSLQELRSQVRQLPDVEAAVRSAEESLAAVGQRVATASAAREAARGRLAAAQAALEQYRSVSEWRQRMLQVLEQLKELGAAEAADRLAEARWREVLSARAASSARLGEVKAETQNVDEQAALLSGEIEQIRARSDAMAQAVASIAALLTPSDEVCPVCRTSHQRPSLKELAEASARRIDRDMAEAEQKLTTVRERRAVLTSECAALERDLARFGQVEAQHKQAAAEVRRLHDALVQHPGLAALPRGQWDAAAAEWLTKAEEERSKAMSGVHAAGNVEQRKPEYEAAQRQVEQDCTVESQVRQTLEDARKRTQVIRDEIKALVTSLDLRADGLTTLDDDLEGAAGEVLSLSTRSATAAETCREAEIRRQHLKANLETARQGLSAADTLLIERQHQMAVLSERWQALAVGEEISLALVEKTKDRIREIQSHARKLDAQRQDLVGRFRAWTEAKELHDLDQQLASLRRQRGTQTDEDLFASLRDGKARADKRRQQLSMLKAQVSRVLETVEQSSSSIQERALEPLNGTWQAFNAALLSSHEFTVSLNCRFGQATAETQVIAGSRAGDVNPELYMSEGQLAALNIGLLLSASITYPWSRWRALLLDDPLQHNDAIHASAFMDVIRNLISDREYQVILSSHDIGEASYFLRKCANASIPTRVCHLLARGANGVVWEDDG